MKQVDIEHMVTPTTNGVNNDSPTLTGAVTPASPEVATPTEAATPVPAKRVLFTATLVRGHIAKFHTPYLKWFKEQGWETWVAAKNDYADGVCEIPYCDHFVDVPFSRSPYNLGAHRAALRTLRQLLAETRFDLIHTHTPVGGVLTRWAARDARKAGTKVFYTAHGFHFYKGAPLQNWLLWYPIERMMSRFTDVLITINQEDFARAKRFAHCKVERVHGIGINLPDRAQFDRQVARKALGIADKDVMVLTIGDVNRNKNQGVLARALLIMPEHFRLFVAGDGELMGKAQDFICEHGLGDRMFLLGFRSDIFDIIAACDVFCLPSLREGLSMSLLEAMAIGVPCLVADTRGLRDVLRGIPEVIVRGEAEEWAACIERITDLSEEERMCLVENQIEKLSAYIIEQVIEEHARIYHRYLNTL